MIFQFFIFQKFFHPDPTVERQSGFLRPKINTSTLIGNTISVPYFHVISDNKDLTIKPTFSTEKPNIFNKTNFFQTEYRQENKNSSIIADFGFVNNFKSKYSNKQKNILHLFAKNNIDLKLDQFKKSQMSIFVEKTNKDTYLKIFDNYLMNNSVKPKNNNILLSGINLELINEKFQFETGFSSYEDLNKRQNDRYQFVLPYYQFNSTFNEKFGKIEFSSNGNNTLQNTNNLRTRIINDININSNDLINSELGLKSNINFYIKNVNTTAKEDETYKSSAQSEIMNIIEINTSYPLKKNTKNIQELLTPKLSLRINPSDMKNHSNFDRKINTNNIFSIDRLALEDSLESGKSVTAGLDYSRKNNLDEEFNAKIATVLRDKREDAVPKQTSLNEKNSYLFSSINYQKKDLLNLEYNLATDNNLKDLVYHDIGVSLSLNNFVTDFNFLQENAEVGTAHILENKTTFNFDENNFISFRTRRNEELNLTEYYDLIYEYKYDCLIAGLKYNKTYYQDRDLEPS